MTRHWLKWVSMWPPRSGVFKIIANVLELPAASRYPTSDGYGNDAIGDLVFYLKHCFEIPLAGQWYALTNSAGLATTGRCNPLQSKR
jgi:hypothetical protein